MRGIFNRQICAEAETLSATDMHAEIVNPAKGKRVLTQYGGEKLVFCVVTFI